MKNLTAQMNGFFITGSDTGVGKSWISCQLIHQLKHTVKSLKVRKPIESGCEVLPNKELKPADGTALFEANDQKENLELITAHRFKLAISPDRAARRENKRVYLNQLQKAVSNNIQHEDTVLVEGAGGFYSPIAEDGLNADLAKLLGLEIIIVIEDRLGAINQSLLSIKAVEAEGLNIKAVILNQVKPDTDKNMDNLADLTKRTQYPVYHCSYQGKLPAINLS